MPRPAAAKRRQHGSPAATGHCRT